MSTRHIHGNPLIIILLVTFISLQPIGCSSTVSVVAEQASRADDIHTSTEVAFLWGLMDRTRGVDCDGNGLQIVSAKTNWFYSLCTVLTLGAVVPLNVEYRCTSAPLLDGGEIGLFMEESE
jgi:hypothetical protein